MPEHDQIDGMGPLASRRRSAPESRPAFRQKCRTRTAMGIETLAVPGKEGGLLVLEATGLRADPRSNGGALREVASTLAHRRERHREVVENTEETRD